MNSLDAYNVMNGHPVAPVLTLGCADGAHATCPRWDYASDRDVAPIDACGCLCHNATHGDRAEYFRTGKLAPREPKPCRHDDAGSYCYEHNADYRDHPFVLAKTTARQNAMIDAHEADAHEGEYETFASMGCPSCYNAVGLGES